MTTLLHRAFKRIRTGAGHERTFPVLFVKFKEILALNNLVHERMSAANEMLSGDYVFDQQYIRDTCEELTALVERLVYNLDSLAPGRYPALHTAFNRIQADMEKELSGGWEIPSGPYILPMERITLNSMEEAGGKIVTLAELSNVLNLPTPSGFAITTAAYKAFLDHNDLRPFIDKALAQWRDGVTPLREVSERIQHRVRSASLPETLRKELSSAVSKLLQKKSVRLAFRSSAVGEDGEFSFAGQHESLLNVDPAKADMAYREVVASLFSEGALEYRQSAGFANREVAMAVACQEMIDAKAGGVLYTLDPATPEKEQMLINATWGLGAPVASGQARTDQFTVSRKPPLATLSVNVVRKESALTSRAAGGTASEPLPSGTQTRPSLSADELHRLAETALIIERYFRKPQDIEFAFDRGGKLVVLQARRLVIHPRTVVVARQLANLDRRYKVLMRNQGVIARKGVAFGKVYVVRNGEDLDHFPDGAILVARQASPIFARVHPKAAGIITDVGAATGHLATVAREFRLPAIFNCGNATEILEDGMEITLDADENVVYQGRVAELSRYKMLDEPMEANHEFRLLQKVLKKIEPLRLLDPAERNFVPEACRSLHDITRFVHEKAVQALIDSHVYSTHVAGSVRGRLKWEIPLDLVIIDIDGGIRERVHRHNIRIDDIRSVPLKALLAGLRIPGAWSNEPMSVDFAGFMSSLTRTFSTELAEPRHVGRNLAVVSREYANVSLRLGYHFTMVDAYVSDQIGDNYIYFRFFGGVTEEARRSRRARLLVDVLTANDFRVEVRGDLVIGRLKGFDIPRMMSRLTMLGALVGFTRQLDVRMVDEERIREFNRQFNSLLEE